MSQPPTGPDSPQENPQSFPTYGREGSSGSPNAEPPSSRPQDTLPMETHQPTQYRPQSDWAAPGQSPTGYGQQPGQPVQPAGYGQQPGQPTYGQPTYPPVYGSQPVPYGYGYGGFQPQTNGLATASLVTALAGFVVCGITAPVAIGLGIAALMQIRQRGQSGRGQAIAGIIIGSLITLVGVFYVIFVAVLGWTSSGSDF